MSEQDNLPLNEEAPQEEPKEAVEKVIADLKARADALEAQLHEEEVARARLEERISQPAVSEPAKPAPLTREQLQEAVDNGQLTQSQMEAELARQLRDSLKAELSKQLRDELQAAERAKAINDEFDGYMKLRPDIGVRGTDDRRKLEAEFAALVRLGQPKDAKATEVLAMRNVFGPLDRVKETTRERREVHQETGGGGAEVVKGSAKSWQNGLTKNQIAIYESQLDKGIYPSETDKMFLAVTTRARTGNAARKAS